MLNIYTEADHIIPPAMSRALKDHVGAKDYGEAVIKGGHIGLFVSPRPLDQVSQTIADWLARR